MADGRGNQVASTGAGSRAAGGSIRLGGTIGIHRHQRQWGKGHGAWAKRAIAWWQGGQGISSRWQQD